MIKILHINTTYYKGGAARIAESLHEHLNSTNEFKSYFAYGRGRKALDKNSYKFSCRLEILLNLAITRITGLQGYGTWVSTKRVIKFIKENKFDIIHLHNIHGYYIDLSLIDFLKAAEIPVVFTLHDYWTMTGRCANPGCDYQWVNGCIKCPSKKAYPETFFDSGKRMCRIKREKFWDFKNSTIVVPSQALYNGVKRSFLKNNKIQVIHNAVDTNIFMPMNKAALRSRYGIGYDKKAVLFTAADLNNPLKGFQYFIEAINFMKIKNIVIITAGKFFNKKIETSHEIMHFGRITDRNKMAEIYNISDVYCTASLDEAFGLTVTEAMSCGIPVAGFRTGGSEEQVTADCGILTDRKDTMLLAKSIEKLLTDKKKHKKFSEECRKNALEFYSLNKFYKSYESIYKRSVKKNKNKSF